MRAFKCQDLATSFKRNIGQEEKLMMGHQNSQSEEITAVKCTPPSRPVAMPVNYWNELEQLKSAIATLEKESGFTS